MDEIYNLKEMLCKELEEYGRKGEMSAGTLEIVDKLAHAVKNLGKIIEMYEEESYSSEGGGQGGRGGMSYEGGYRYSREGNRGGGSRYYREGGRGGNSYARGRGRNANRDSRGRYASTADSVQEMAETLGEMMGELPEEAKREAQKLMQKLEQMM